MPDNSESFFDHEIFDGPIELIQSLAEYRAWDFERLDNRQIAVSIDGQYTSYLVTVGLTFDNCLRIICAYAVEPPEQKVPALVETLNRLNGESWNGSVSYWDDEQLVVWRNQYSLQNCDDLDTDQVEEIIRNAVSVCDAIYPCIALAVWGEDHTPKTAIQAFIHKTYGTA